MNQGRWNLDTIFPGGSKSNEFKRHILKLNNKVNQMESTMKEYDTPEEVTGANADAILNGISEILTDLTEASSFITCLLTEKPADSEAITLQAELLTIQSRFDLVHQRAKKVLIHSKDRVSEGNLDTYVYLLQVWEQESRWELSHDQESLLSGLMPDGYHSWGTFYQALIRDLTVMIKINGVEKEFSFAQALNLRAHHDEEVRKASHVALENVWTQKQDLFARILNHIGGFRLHMYKTRGLENVLTEPLVNNRMEEETLESMWTSINKYKHHFIRYLDKKAEMLGESSLSAYNFWAPISEHPRYIEYHEAVSFISKHFRRFGPEMGAFARHAFNDGWVEAEDRPGKSATPFCASFPLSGESRVFMTYGGSILNVLTLTHELGHAFHNHAMKDVEGGARKYPMSLAETASFFAETICLDAAIEESSSLHEKLFLLDEKIKRGVMNFMNIHSRFIFEKNFYSEREKGMVSSTRLNELMRAATEEAYGGSLVKPSYYSWIWTPHYYITSAPFYNFPYTFGYLFATCIYAMAREKGEGFERDYMALLQDSGRMPVKELVMKYLGEDLSTEGFWEKGLQLCMKDVEQYLLLSQQLETVG
ncbi:M3 family oligoendopeptidase [Rossellomorea aquimaris]|uniref:M3 family oligoendopeptidase n=1 Tax=Rossellomorea aquimaris TaxID=189382 RepID=UPI001CD61D4C|nr:M3 family oligoendopeptidase [Rossellomorea aquimaris]MCA1053995.1 M3 family oligoendopeptidase [Rossellomorea aquimaris]